MEKTCANCKHSYRDQADPKYLRCDLAAGIEDKLAGEMRRVGPCGPDATLWDAHDG